MVKHREFGDTFFIDEAFVKVEGKQPAFRPPFAVAHWDG